MPDPAKAAFRGCFFLPVAARKKDISLIVDHIKFKNETTHFLAENIFTQYECQEKLNDEGVYQPFSHPGV